MVSYKINGICEWEVSKSQIKYYLLDLKIYNPDKLKDSYKL